MAMLRFKDQAEFDARRRSADGYVDYYPYTSEVDVQRATLGVLRSHPRVAWCMRMNSGAGRLLYPDGETSRFIRFGFEGLADIIGQLIDGRFLGCECKLRGKRPTGAQQAFIDAVNGAKGLAFWVDDPRQVYAQIPVGPTP